jgi:hypothetical protein
METIERVCKIYKIISVEEYEKKNETKREKDNNCKDSKQLEFCNCIKCAEHIQEIYKTTQFIDEDIVQLRHIYKEHKLTLPRLLTYLEHEHTSLILELELLPLFFSYFNTENKTDGMLSFIDFVNAIAILTGTSKKISSKRFFFDICSENKKMTEHSINKIFNADNELCKPLCSLIIAYNKKWDIDNKGYTVWDEVNKGIETMNPINNKVILSIFKGYRLSHKT